MDIKSNIIGFAGKMRSGKSECAHYLRDIYGFKIVTIANSLKKLCVELLQLGSIEELNNLKNQKVIINAKPDDRWIDIISERTNINKDAIKHELNDRVFPTVRDLLQKLGTDIIRKHNKNWHVEQTVQEINQHIANNEKVVVDDVRFPNERQAIEDIGGVVFYVVRPDLPEDNHPSETSLSYEMFAIDRVIFNSQTLSELRESLNLFLNTI